MSIEEIIRRIIREEIQSAIDELKRELKLVNEQKDLPSLLTVEETANILRISKSRVYELSHHNDFPAIRSGRQIRIPRDRLFEWIEEKASMRKYVDAGNGLGMRNEKYFGK